jgi:hypothetical protein
VFYRSAAATVACDLAGKEVSLLIMQLEDRSEMLPDPLS